MGSCHIDWASRESHLLLNPHLPFLKSKNLKLTDLPQLDGHIWLASSGTTNSSQLKLFALSKEAFLTSANAVNEHLQVGANDIWLNVLPHFHVGGLSIWARAYLSKSRVVDYSDQKWSAEIFLKAAYEFHPTLSSLVPTQVFDLVTQLQTQTRLDHATQTPTNRTPESLRAIIVGGAHLDMQLHERAQERGLELLPSFGMTEVCSQVATAELGSNNFRKLKILKHIQTRLMPEGELAIQSPSLFTASAIVSTDKNIEVSWRNEDWYITQDRVLLSDGYLEPLGRTQDQIKISGEMVDLFLLQKKMSEICRHDEFVLFAEPDARRGHEVAVIFEMNRFGAIDAWISQFNNSILPVAKIRRCYLIDKLSRTAIGKMHVSECRKRIQ